MLLGLRSISIAGQSFGFSLLALVQLGRAVQFRGFGFSSFFEGLWSTVVVREFYGPGYRVRFDAPFVFRIL